MALTEFNFLKEHPNYAFNAICKNYPFTGDQLRKFRNILLWDTISDNGEIEWSVGVIHVFQSHLLDKNRKLNSSLCFNEAIPWSVELIKPFEKIWQWDCLGQNSKIENNQIIQDVFREYLEPVNAWLGPKSSNDATNQEISNTRLWVPDEIEKNIDSMDWVLLSIDENSFYWNFELLKTYEKYVDFGSLSVNRQAWIECFGKLTDDDIESILTDKEVQSQLVSYSILDDMSEEEKSQINIPECLTYKYFLKSYIRK